MRAALLAALVTACQTGWSTTAMAQSWQPTRVSPTSQARQLGDQPTAVVNGLAQSNSSTRNQRPHEFAASEPQAERLGNGVVLRWTSTAVRPSASQATGSAPTAQATFDQSPAAAVFANSASHVSVAPAVASSSNPLRAPANVRAANYQQTDDVYQDPFGDEARPTLPGGNQLPGGLPPLPGDIVPPNATAPNSPDPLAAPELAPDPNALQLNDAPNPFNRNRSGVQDPSPLDRNDASGPVAPELIDDPGTQQLDTLSNPNRRRRAANTLSCETQRDRVKNLPLTSIDLDVSPNYGEGLRSVKQDTEEQRLDFAASAEVRSWSDYQGRVIATGRLIDLRDDRVVLDVDGSEKTIPFRDLSDGDVAYVGEAWNIPQKCGTGYEPFVGRDFIASTVQWSASGACHKPLYFEQVQLERYGHEAGPVLQPLISSVHFFGNIAVLPYKMGIHPPNECQYSLGYIRPGNCAPYMLQPIPWSLRGALTQAGAVTGAAALIP